MTYAENRFSSAKVTGIVNFASAAYSDQRSYSSLNTDSAQLRFTNQQFDQTPNAHPALQQLRRTPAWRYAYVASLVAVDAVAMLFALVFCLTLNPATYEGLESHLSVQAFAVLQCAVWIICLLLCGTYHRHVMSEGYELYTKIINASILTVVFTSFSVYMLSLNLPRTSVITAPLMAGLLETFNRWQMRRILHHWRTKGECQYHAVIIGSPEGIDAMVSKLSKSKSSGYRPIAVCPIARDPECTDGSIVAVPYEGQTHTAVPTTSDGTTEGPDVYIDSQENTEGDDAELPVITYSSNLPRTAERMGAQIVIVADVISRDNEVMHTLPLAVESLGIELAVSVSVADISAHRIDLDYSGNQPILIATLPQYSFTTRFVKRLMDIIGSTIALIISGPLIILPAAVAIKLEDHGPAFYRQRRVGRNEVPFDCYKLRSMKVNADKLDGSMAQSTGQQLGALFKVKDDPRVTKVGRFIRKYSIDEFPQFLNVLKGDMSLVGPRPQRQYEVDSYGPLYSTRLLVRPGITGPWQISGRSDLSQEEAEQLDISYIQRWSITGDIAILAKTFTAVIRHKGSY
ncbi:sugar transferase [Bifidobacterium xylocopae]|uniref:Exopolysaccharide biosynthesis polyprenyl glycosylphosphotransferase n=1 Tax=Bifidobacterium xylocopae TaxID=2493119 RepID=A0A366KD79_9BIFI|nr:sugar transferase [Bifidobacterium xylocopae]RBP99696.1 exopolysaccharide biosynthesis polyprenyl glycosylphosphotransferase [Bifidobacterium xylocopae]